MEEVCLIIKAPNQKYDDLKVNCKLSWTIFDLKMHLFKEYPSKPVITDQRLIYSGHLLNNDQCLRDIITSPEEDNAVTFHLVCSQKQSSNINQSLNKNIERENIHPQSTQAEVTSTHHTTTPNVSNILNENPFLNSVDPTLTQASYNAMLNQYYQYMSYYYLSAPPNVDLASYYAFTNAYMRGFNGSNPPFINANATPETNVANNANGADVNQPNVAQNNQIQNNNNQVDNEEANRDWTELLYSMSKAMVMLSIMYFYSSLGRLLLLTTIGFVLYFYRNLRLANLQNILNNNNNNEQDININRDDPQPNEQPNEQANNEANNNQPDQNPVEQNNNQTVNGAGENLPYTGIRLVWVFVSSLFTSLIPDPTPIN